jgi:hypothetical protein
MGGNIGIGADKIPLLVIFYEYDANPFFAIKDSDFFVDWWKL